MIKYKYTQLSPNIYERTVINDERKTIVPPPHGNDKKTISPNQCDEKTKLDCIRSVETSTRNIRNIMNPTLYQALEEGRKVIAVTLSNSTSQPIDGFLKTVNRFHSNIKKRLYEYGYFTFIEAKEPNFFHLHCVFWELDYASRKITEELMKKYWHNGSIKIDILFSQEKIGQTIYYLTNYSDNKGSKQACQKREALQYLPMRIRIIRHSNRGIRKPLNIWENEFDYCPITSENASVVLSSYISKCGMNIYKETIVTNDSL